MGVIGFFIMVTWRNRTLHKYDDRFRLRLGNRLREVHTLCRIRNIYYEFLNDGTIKDPEVYDFADIPHIRPMIIPLST